MNPRTTDSVPPPGSILARGLALVVRHWPVLLWLYAINFLLAIAATLPLLSQIRAFTANSLYAGHLSGVLDLGALLGLSSLINEHSRGVLFPAYLFDFVFVAFLYLTTPGILSIYLENEPATLGNMLRAGLNFFWRFIRLALMLALPAAIILGILAALRGAVLHKLDATYVERDYFIWGLAFTIIIAIIAIFFRIWLDLAQVVVVDRGTYRIGYVEDRRSRKAIGPALRLFRFGFLRVYAAFVFVGILGWAAAAIFLLIWHFLPPTTTILAFVCGQAALFCLLVARLWQRGLEISWVAGAGPILMPVPVVEPLVAPPMPSEYADQITPLSAGSAPIPQLPEIPPDNSPI